MSRCSFISYIQPQITVSPHGRAVFQDKTLCTTCDDGCRLTTECCPSTNGEMIHLCTIPEHSKKTPSPCLSVEVVTNLEVSGWCCNGNARCPLVHVNEFCTYWAVRFKAECLMTILAVPTHKSKHGPGCLSRVKKERPHQNILAPPSFPVTVLVTIHLSPPPSVLGPTPADCPSPP